MSARVIEVLNDSEDLRARRGLLGSLRNSFFSRFDNRNIV